YGNHFGRLAQVIWSAGQIEDPTIHYNLAYYECQLGNLSAAKEHLVRATKTGVKFRTMALDDTDLEPLWSEIARARRLTPGFWFTASVCGDGPIITAASRTWDRA